MEADGLKLTDTHCHLDFDRFDEDREAMIERAFAAGVERMLIPGLDEASNRAALTLAEKYNGIYVAVGVQPNYGLTWQDSSIDTIRQQAGHPAVVAIGEIGLDYYWDKMPKELQKNIFQQQLDLAAELNLPVVIHNREATSDILTILLNWQNKLSEQSHDLAKYPGVLHSYSGNIEQAKQALTANFYLGFTGPVTFKKADELRAVVASVPLDRMLIETDAPFLTPQPYRGKRNEPAYVRYVAEKIAEIHQISVSELSRKTSENAARLFRW